MIEKSYNPHQRHPISLIAFSQSLYKNRQLVFQMCRREVLGRYRGSMIGIAWSFLNPFLMLTVYTFIFSVVYKARWGATGSDSKVEFALILFVGMIVFNFFSEVINRAPNLILSNVNYVKKVVFPLELLCVISLGVSFFHALIGFFALALAYSVFNGNLNWTFIFLPVIFLPFIFFTLGISLILASLGTYIRDIGQMIGVLMSILMFLTPIFYPVSALPLKFQSWIMLNPLTFIIEQMRSVVIYGEIPDWQCIFYYLLMAVLIMWIGYMWFQKTRKGFADVL